MYDAVQDGRSHDYVTEDSPPVLEVSVGGEDGSLGFVAVSDDFKEVVEGLRRKGSEADFVQDEDIRGKFIPGFAEFQDLQDSDCINYTDVCTVCTSENLEALRSRSVPDLKLSRSSPQSSVECLTVVFGHVLHQNLFDGRHIHTFKDIGGVVYHVAIFVVVFQSV